MKRICVLVSLTALLAGCGSGENNAAAGSSVSMTGGSADSGDAPERADTFIDRVLSVLGSTADDTEPSPVDDAPITSPEDTEPRPFV